MKNLSKDAKTIVDFLDCPCEVISTKTSKKKIMEAYKKACAEGKGKCTPILIAVSDTLAEWVDILKKDEMKENETPAEYHKRLLNEPEFDAEGWFKEKYEEYDCESMFVEDSLDRCPEDFLEEFEDELEDDDLVNNEFSGYGSSKEVILAKIPTVNPWEVFAWMPFGGWNECPTADVMMAVSKRWYEKYGSVPTVISHDILEYSAKPVEDHEEAKKLAMEQFIFCVDIVEQGVETLDALTVMLEQSTVWFFWWD